MKRIDEMLYPKSPFLLDFGLATYDFKSVTRVVFTVCRHAAVQPRVTASGTEDNSGTALIQFLPERRDELIADPSSSSRPLTANSKRCRVSGASRDFPRIVEIRSNLLYSVLRCT